MKIITSIDGADISSDNIDDISYSNIYKGWKLLAQGSKNIYVPNGSGVLSFTIPNLPDNGIGIVYVINDTVTPNKIYQLPRSNANTIENFPQIDSYSLDNSIVIKTIHNLFTGDKNINIVYLWMEKQ